MTVRQMLRKRLTFANVMSSLAVFIALGGTAVALKANSVGSRQIRDGAIKGRDVGDGKLKGQNLAEATIGSRELDEYDFDLDHFVGMESQSGGCDPTSTEFVICSTLTLSQREPTRALLIGTGGQTGTANARGTCKFVADGVDYPDDTSPTSVGDPQARGISEYNGFALTAVTKAFPAIPPNPRDYSLVCNEISGDVRFHTALSVIALGGTPAGDPRG